MPFFNANKLSAEFEEPGGIFRDPAENWAKLFAKRAQSSLRERLTWISGAAVEEELKKLGTYRGYRKEAGRNQRTGFTLSEAIQTGRALGADAVLLGAVTIADTDSFRQAFLHAVSVRLIDVHTGRVIWAASAYKKKSSDSSAIPKILEKLKEDL